MPVSSALAGEHAEISIIIFCSTEPVVILYLNFTDALYCLVCVVAAAYPR